MKNLFGLLLFTILIGFSACTSTPEPVEEPPVEEEVTNNIYTATPLMSKFTEEIKAKPNDPELYFQRAQLLYDMDSYPETIGDMQKAIALDSVNFLYHHLLADAYLDNLESEKSLAALERTYKMDTTRIQTLLKWSEFLHILKQYDASNSIIDRILRLDNTHPEAFYMLGRNFKETKDTIRAINSFQKVVEEDPDHIDAYQEMGNLFDQMGKPIAVKFFDNALSIDSTSMDALFGKAFYYHKKNDFKNAEKWYKKAGRFHPENADIHFNLGYMLMEQKKYEEAKKKFDIAVSVEPVYPKGYYYRGLTYEYLGKPEQAIVDYKQCTALDVNYTKANEALRRLGENPIGIK